MESSTTTTPAQSAVDAATVAEALRRTAANHPDLVAVRTPDDGVTLTWSELLQRVDALAGGLAKLGVEHGECVAIMLSNRPEFHIADLATVTVGATPFSIYVTYPANEIEFLITDSAARVAIVEQAFLPVILEARQNLPGLEHVIVVDGEARRMIRAPRNQARLDAERAAGPKASSRSMRWRARIRASTAQRRARGSAPTTWPRSSTRRGPPAIPRASSSPTTPSCSPRRGCAT